jgi:hypothetical protein
MDVTKDEQHERIVALVRQRMAELYAEKGPPVWDLVRPYLDELIGEANR